MLSIESSSFKSYVFIKGRAIVTRMYSPITQVIAKAALLGGLKETDLANLLRVLARMRSRQDVDGMLVPENDVPGYLARDVGPCKIRVPFNLAFVSPVWDQYISILNAADLLKLQPSLELCISGSATFLGRSNLLSDVDIAEYYCADVRLIGNFVDQMARKETSQKAVEYVKVYFEGGGHFRDRKWPFKRAAKRCEGRSWTKMFIQGQCDLLGRQGMKISNMVLPVEPGAYSSKSYIYQEIVASDSGTLNGVRSLAKDGQLTGYAGFLLGAAVETLAADDYIKALKRALALAMLLLLVENVSEGLAILKEAEQMSPSDARVKERAREYVGAVIRSVGDLQASFPQARTR